MSVGRPGSSRLYLIALLYETAVRLRPGHCHVGFVVNLSRAETNRWEMKPAKAFQRPTTTFSTTRGSTALGSFEFFESFGFFD